MNAKTCKSLRGLAMGQSLPGEPLRQLVQYRQETNGKRDKPGQPPYRPIGAVNNPKSFRGRYRNLKSGRIIDEKRILVEQTFTHGKQMVTHTTTAGPPVSKATKPKMNWLQKMSSKFNRIFRHQAR